MASEMERMRQRSQRAKQRGDWLEVVELLEKYRKALPDDKAAALDLGDALMKLERFDDACRFYAELLETCPKDPLVASNFGGALLRCGKINEAKTVLEYSLELNPKNIYARINLGGVYQTLRDYHGALKNALEAVSIDPTHPLAFNNLGSAFSDLAKFEEAKHAYETAVLLDPTSVDALINLATTEVKLGCGEKALEMFEKVLTMLPPEAQQRADAVKFFASFEYLRLGSLKKGWDYYEGGFSPLVPKNGRRTPERRFHVPLWSGEPLYDGRLLIWREQGLGDEILFGTCLNDVVAKSFDQSRVIFECDSRMIDIWRRTFPEFEVRPESFDKTSLACFIDFKFQIPLGSLPRLFRPTLEAFSASPLRRLVPCERRVARWQQWLSERVSRKLVVGICWRSGLIDPNRWLEYSNLLDWSGLLSDRRFNFINLQYDKCESELLAAEQEYGIEILRPPFDLKNDLDDVLALMHSLDLFVGSHTAVLHLAAHSGLKVVAVDGSTELGWPYLGASFYPWYPNVLNLSKEALRKTGCIDTAIP